MYTTIMANNAATGASAINGEFDKASSPATYTMRAIIANRANVAISLIGLLINRAPD